MTIWQHGRPPRTGWYVTDRDNDLRRYYVHEGAGRWSAPVHVDDLNRVGARVRTIRGESQDVEWRAAPAPLDRGPDENSILRCWQAIRRGETAGAAVSPQDCAIVAFLEHVTGGEVVEADRPALVAYLRAVFEQDRRGVSEAFR